MVSYLPAERILGSMTGREIMFRKGWGTVVEATIPLFSVGVAHLKHEIDNGEDNTEAARPQRWCGGPG